MDRVATKHLKRDQACGICCADFVDDPHPLVVQLPCGGFHRFDLECIAPWLKVHATCPMCRVDLMKRKPLEITDDEEEEEDWEMYG